MLKYTDVGIVFQEIPDEVTLAVNLSGCPCRCPGCHSKHLWRDEGAPLTDDALDKLLSRQPSGVSCVAFMGGDAAPEEVDALASWVKRRHPWLHTAWYSGRTLLAKAINLEHFDYLKLGPYLAHLGPLKSPTTNQRLYRVAHTEGNSSILQDLTSHFWKRNT